MADRPALKIEVTRAMADAGAMALLDADTDLTSWQDRAASAYRAMEAARLEESGTPARPC